MTAQKRILSVIIRRMMDTDADTSYLGTYSNIPSDTYSIDRKHTVECAVNQGTAQETVDKLERVISYLEVQRQEIQNRDAKRGWPIMEAPLDYIAVSEAQDILIELQEDSFCDCDEDGDYSRGEYRYFNTSGNYSGEPIEDIRKYTIQDYERMERLQAGDWSYIGIKATAEVLIGGTVQTLSSGGIWGIESDSGEDYLKETGDEELSELRTILYDAGFSVNFLYRPAEWRP